MPGRDPTTGRFTGGGGGGETFGLWGIKLFGDTTGLKTDLDRAVAMTGKASSTAASALGSVAKAARDDMASAFKSMGSITGDVLGGITSAVFNLKTAIAAAVGTLGVASLVKGFIEAGAEVESYKTRLEAMTGSQAEANRLFKYMADLAATTPFELPNVVQAGITLKSFGADVEKTLKPVGDLAAFMGVDIVEAAGAFGRAFAAGAGAADILRERGVLALIQMKSGVDDLTTLSLPQFRDVLLRVMTDATGGIAGATDKLSTKWLGMTSNLRDAWFQFKNQVAEAGLFDFAERALKDLLAQIDELKKNGQLQAWAKIVSDYIIDAFVKVAQFLDANLVSAIQTATKGFLIMEVAVRGVANGVLILENGILGLRYAIDAGGLAIRKMLGIEESLGVTTEEVEKRLDRTTTMIAENSKRIGEFSRGINEALNALWQGEGTGMSDALKARLQSFAEILSRGALKIEDWAERAKASGTTVAEATAKSAEEIQKEIAQKRQEQMKEQLRLDEEALKAARARGEASYQDELNFLNKRIALLPVGTAARKQAEAEAAKFAQDTADRVFEHERALGLRSLEDEIARQKLKVEATLAGTEARMKAEETLFRLQQELQKKRQQAVPGAPGGAPGGFGEIPGAELTPELSPEERGQKFPGDWKKTIDDLYLVGREDLIDALYAKYGPTGDSRDLFRMQVEAGRVPPPIFSPELLTPPVGGGFAEEALRGLRPGPSTPQPAEDWWIKKQMGLDTSGVGESISGVKDAWIENMSTAETEVGASVDRILNKIDTGASRMADSLFERFTDQLIDRLQAEAARS